MCWRAVKKLLTHYGCLLRLLPSNLNSSSYDKRQHTTFRATCEYDVKLERHLRFRILTSGYKIRVSRSQSRTICIVICTWILGGDAANKETWRMDCLSPLKGDRRWPSLIKLILKAQKLLTQALQSLRSSISIIRYLCRHCKLKLIFNYN